MWNPYSRTIREENPADGLRPTLLLCGVLITSLLVSSRGAHSASTQKPSVASYSDQAFTIQISPPNVKFDVLIQHNDIARTGAAQHEDVLTPSTPEAIPLRTGAVWTYRGSITRRTNPDSIPASFRTSPVSLEVKVIRAVRRRKIVAAMLQGFFFDLFGSGAKRGPYAIVEAGRRVYLLEGSEAESALKRLEDPKDGLYKLVNESELLFGTPLATGQKYCESDEMTRDDDMYCWNVTGGRPFRRGSVKGASPGATVEYELASEANDGNDIFGIVLGLGITRFSFQTRCAACGDRGEVRLVEYKGGTR